jgi:hypothetical protein
MILFFNSRPYNVGGVANANDVHTTKSRTGVNDFFSKRTANF